MEPGAPGAAHWPGAPSRAGPSGSRGSPADQRHYRRARVGNLETEEIPLRGRVRFANGRGQLREAGTQERPPDDEGDLCRSARPSETDRRPSPAQSRSRGVHGDTSGSRAAASRAASPRRTRARGASARLPTTGGSTDRNRTAIPRIAGRDCTEYPGRHDGGTAHRATPVEPGIARSKHGTEDTVDSAPAIDRRGSPDACHRWHPERVWVLGLGYFSQDIVGVYSPKYNMLALPRHNTLVPSSKALRSQIRHKVLRTSELAGYYLIIVPNRVRAPSYAWTRSQGSTR